MNHSAMRKRVYIVTIYTDKCSNVTAVYDSMTVLLFKANDR